MHYQLLHNEKGSVPEGQYMTEQEFLHLRTGTVIFDRFHENEKYIIYGTDEMGTAYKGNHHRVYGARQLGNDDHFVRIDLQNCQFWTVDRQAVEIR